MRPCYALCLLNILNLVLADQKLATPKCSKTAFMQREQGRFRNSFDTITPNRQHNLNNYQWKDQTYSGSLLIRLRGGSGGVGLESGRNEMIKRARSFELVRIPTLRAPI
jgi:hypothetical protein